jgi:putative DNA primase/helicase
MGIDAIISKVKANGKPWPGQDDGEKRIEELANLKKLAYAKVRTEAATELGIRVGDLDKMVREKHAQSEDVQAELPHWKVEPWDQPVSTAELLSAIRKAFRRYIVLPKGAGVASPLWTLHAWTMDAGDISPFLVFVSPTKRCGKTSAMTVLLFLTPRSELASNISPSALFRYVEAIRPTLLIDEADTFLKGNEEFRGILNAGHTRVAANVVRNVEVNGDHKPRRFSTWAPKAIATIQSLADTLEDRSVIVQLQRKPKDVKVDRLRKRDNAEFATLRRQAARWAEDNFDKLADPDPAIPEVLNDRAADNWRPLLAIADLAGGEWPRLAREAACILSGEEHDTSPNIELLIDIRIAFGDDDEIRTVDLIAKLIADPERPWVEWSKGKPITAKHIGRLLRDFKIISENVNGTGYSQAKGYKRSRFEDAWTAYCPGQTPSAPEPDHFSRPSVHVPAASAQHDDFASVHDPSVDGSKNSTLSHSHRPMDGWTGKKPVQASAHGFDHVETPASTPSTRPPARAPAAPSTTPPRTDGAGSAAPEPAQPKGEQPRGRCVQCNGPIDGKERLFTTMGVTAWLHPECEPFYPFVPKSCERRPNGGRLH